MSCFSMLILISLHCIICVRVALRLAEQKLLVQQPEPGATFNPRAKIRVVRISFVAICLIIGVRSVLLLISAVGNNMLQTKKYPYCSSDNDQALLLSRIIENECVPLFSLPPLPSPPHSPPFISSIFSSLLFCNSPFIQPIMSSILEPITLLVAFQKLGSGYLPELPLPLLPHACCVVIFDQLFL